MSTSFLFLLKLPDACKGGKLEDVGASLVSRWRRVPVFLRDFAKNGTLTEDSNIFDNVRKDFSERFRNEADLEDVINEAMEVILGDKDLSLGESCGFVLCKSRFQRHR